MRNMLYLISIAVIWATVFFKEIMSDLDVKVETSMIFISGIKSLSSRRIRYVKKKFERIFARKRSFLIF